MYNFIKNYLNTNEGKIFIEIYIYKRERERKR